VTEVLEMELIIVYGEHF